MVGSEFELRIKTKIGRIEVPIYSRKIDNLISIVIIIRRY